MLLCTYVHVHACMCVVCVFHCRQNVDAILSLWSRLQNTSKEECIRLYLQRVRRIPAFGFRHFQVTRLSLSGSSRATIAVGEDGIQIKISSSSQQVPSSAV